MKKTSLLLAVFIAMVVLPVALFAQAKPRLAILPFTGGTGHDGETIAELFSFEPEIDRVFTRIPRTSSIDAIMREQQFQRSTGLTDSDTIARLGQQLNADFVVAGHIQVLGSSRLVLVTIIHVESLQQVAGDYKEYRNIEEMQGLIPDMAARIAHASQIRRNNLPRLAVLPFATSAAGVNQSDAEVLAQLLATEIANSGRYAVLPRTTSIQSVMREHDIQRSGLTETNNIRRIGEALNAQYVLAGNVRRLGQANMFTAQILEVENASLLVGHAENYNTIADGLTSMAALSRRLAGGASPAPAAASSASDSGTFPSWRNNVDGGNSTVKNGTTANYSTGRETIQGQQRDVMIFEVNLVRGSAWRIGQFIIEDAEFLQRLRQANGIRFKVLGDGAAGWRVQFPTSDTMSDYAHFETDFTTRRNNVVNIDIPFSGLRQPSWGRRVSFNKGNISSLSIQRYAGDNSNLSGSSTIKVFDFEIY